MEYVVIGLAALFASGLTLFSGFGLGTLLMPVFAIFFHIDVAIALTAIVHLLNNIFKLFLLGKNADLKTVLKFGIPAIFAAFLGAWVLFQLSDDSVLYSYQLFGSVNQVTPVKLVIAILMIIFALFDILPALRKISFGKQYLPLGGVLSGFFGGLSGHQGALRSVFLLKTGLTKESFIATGVVIATIIDFSRLFLYTSKYAASGIHESYGLLITAIILAFAGAFLGNKLVKKVTLQSIHILVSIMLIAIALALGAGII